MAQTNVAVAEWNDDDIARIWNAKNMDQKTQILLVATGRMLCPPILRYSALDPNLQKAIKTEMCKPRQSLEAFPIKHRGVRGLYA